ncbi:MAG: hypothetical protein ACYC96_13300 [Fimbriimonadaceae bacterium]
MTQVLIRAVRASAAWLLAPIPARGARRTLPLCAEAWLAGSKARAQFRRTPSTPANDGGNPPKRSTIPRCPAWMVHPC